MNDLELFKMNVKGQSEANKMIPTVKLALFLSIIFIFANTNVTFGFDIKLSEKMEISPDSQLLSIPWDFCVTEDGLFIIPDPKAGNIKIYDRIGKFLVVVEIIGKKGFGADEFGEPTYCSYNKDKLAVMDYRLRKVFIYDRISRSEFKRRQEFHCWWLGTDIEISGNRLFIAGYQPDPDGYPYDLFYIDLSGSTKNSQIRKVQRTYLLRSYYKYGLKSFDEYERIYRNEPYSYIKAIGINSWFDVQGDEVYYAWEGDLRVIKLNIKPTLDEEPTFFGEKPPHYKKPSKSFKMPALVNAYRNRDFSDLKSAKSEMYYVRNIFTSSNNVILIYEGPNTQGKSTTFRAQIYSLEGGSMKETNIPGKPDRRMWFDKEKNILYSLSSQPVEIWEKYFILKYKVEE